MNILNPKHDEHIEKGGWLLFLGLKRSSTSLMYGNYCHHGKIIIRLKIGLAITMFK